MAVTELRLNVGDPGRLLLRIVAIWIIFRLAKGIYSIYYHPLSKFPGPRLAAASILPATFLTFRGCLQEWVAEQHRCYGPIVRIRPNELSFITDLAWKDIYAHRQGHPQMAKVLRTKPINGAPSLMSANDPDHARQRKFLSNAFSDQALREQEPVLRRYVDLLIKQLRDESDAGGKAVDMVEWYTFTTFDIIGDLSLGTPFGNLAKKEAHPWVSTFKSGIKQGILFVAFRSLGIPLFDSLIQRLVSPILQRKRHQQFKHAQTAVTKRLSKKTERPDFMTNFLRYNDLGDVSRDEIESIFTILALAGCESPATALSGATYYLLSNPSAYKKLEDEIRSLPTDADITIANLSRLSYLKAVLDESLRVYPPVPAAMDRVVPAEGRTISGHWIPGGTWVGIPQLAAYHSPSNFEEPDSFIPERYMEKHDPRFDKDNRAVVQPFSMGPRNCIGQNLAKAEMRLILAKMVWHFDMQLANPKSDWTKQPIYGLWDKNPLLVKLTPKA